MANYNLTNQDIKDTFEQLAQVSGSIEGGVAGSGVTDGTGSRITNLHVTASSALSSSTATSAISSSHAVQADSALTATSASHAVASDTSISASHALQANNSISASFALTASFAENVTPIDTGSFIITGSISDATTTYTKADGSSFGLTVNNVVSSSYALSASYAVSASVEIIKEVSSSYADFAQTAESASYAATATSASYSLTASFLEGSVASASYAATASSVNTLNQDVTLSGSLNLGEYNAIITWPNSTSVETKIQRTSASGGQVGGLDISNTKIIRFEDFQAGNTNDDAGNIRSDRDDVSGNQLHITAQTKGKFIGPWEFDQNATGTISNALYADSVKSTSTSTSNDDKIAIWTGGTASGSYKYLGEESGFGGIDFTYNPGSNTMKVGNIQASGSQRFKGGQIQLGDTGSGNSIDLPENGTTQVKGSTDFTNGAAYFGDQLNVGGTFSMQGGGSTVNIADGTSVNINADMNLSASKQLIGTASYAMFAETTSGTITNAATASYVNPLVQDVEITGSLDVTGSVDINGNLTATGFIGGAGGIQIGEASTSPVQFPLVKLNGDSGLGSIYAGFQISDDSSTANTNFAVSTFTGLDGSNPVFELIGPSTNRLLWSSANFPYFNVPVEIKGAAGLQVTGSVNITGSTDIDGVLSLPGIANVSASIAAGGGGGAAFPFTGSAGISGSLAIDGEAPNLDVNTSVKGGTPNIRMYQAFNGSDVKFANFTINDSTGTYSSPTLIGRFSNAVSAFGNAAGSPFTLLAGGAAGGAFAHWGLVLDQTGDIKSLKEMNMYSGAKVSGSLVVTGSATLTGSLDVNGTLSLPGISDVSASIAAGGGGGSAFPFTGSAGITGSLTVDGNTKITGSADITSTITSHGGSIQSFGGGGITVGNSGYALQYPSMNVYTNSGSYGGQIYGSHRITDLSGNNDVGILALSTFNAGDPGRICFETQFNSDVVWWISENENRFHVEKEVKAKAGLQVTGSVNITGSTDIDGVLSLPGITNVSASIASAGGGSAFPYVGAAAITGSLNISGSVTNNIATPPLTSSGGTGFDFTASLDFNQANMFNIALDNGSTYHFKPYNLNPGQTATLRVPQAPDGNGAIGWSPEFKFPGGNVPTATQGSGAEDIYTFVMYDTGSVYAVQTPGLA